MCGIIGIASTGPLESESWLLAGRDAMSHRGPDDAGHYLSDDRRVAFGHRRLSIVDLSPLGHQPMATSDGALWICYNGEIYNHLTLRCELEALGHRFHSTSDTEILLASYRQWGKDFLHRIDGMFAFALHDVREGKLLLARDRAGEKPLFYRLAADGICFASELKGLFADPAFERCVDRTALDCYLGMGYVPGERSMLAGVSKLRAAHAMVFDLAGGGGIESWRYWSPPAFEATSAGPDELVDRLEQLLEDSVRRQLVADVPVGLLLSGGVDSSVITALASRAGGRLKTFTVGFQGFADYDETEHAALVAKHFDTDHTVLQAGEVGPELMALLARQYDEPMIDSSMIPTYLVTQRISQHCKVALGGDGGDELFGGYHATSQIARLQHNLRNAPLWPRRMIAGAAEWLLPVGMRGRARLRMYGVDTASELQPMETHFEPIERKLLLGADWATCAEAIRAAEIPNERDAVQRITRADFANYMVDDILVKVDRASMLNSLEVRSPFLDRHVIDFAYGQVPSSLKATPSARKIILRRLAARLLPAGFDSARKQGFGIPLDRWLRGGEWRRHFEDVLLDPGCTFDRRAVSALFARLDSGQFLRERLFGLTLFEQWRRTYDVRLNG